MAGSTYDRFHVLVRPHAGFFESDAVRLAIECDVWAWSDPRFTTGMLQVLYQTFLKTQDWVKGRFYLDQILANADACVDADLVDIARDLLAGHPPKNEAWYGGASYQSSWPAHPKQYTEQWNGQMFLYSVEHQYNQSLLRSLKRKTRKPQRPNQPIRTPGNPAPDDVVFMDEQTGEWMRRINGQVRQATEAEFNDAVSRRRLI